jgi:hypothetical protein
LYLCKFVFLPVYLRESSQDICGLRVHKVSAPLTVYPCSPSFLYTMVDPCGRKIKLSHKHADPYINLNSSLIPTMYSILMALDDVLNDGQTHEMTQHHDTFAQPPGAVTTGFPSLTPLRQAEFPLEDLLPPGNLEAHTTQMPTTLSIVSQSDGSEASVYTLSPADPTLSLPSPAHVLKLRPSFFRSS